ncbi:MAG TPA: HypC/HybG/HupF family hydrogenase formation chaperone [Nitrososphaerales archaeon]|nr:HypC/HybG/HupF family hydrogenase formation chaperone [Nitrososphaerales archaeon]
MCISRIGKVLSTNKTKAKVQLLGDDRIVDDIDITMISAKVDSYIEVFSNIALSVISPREAMKRKKMWVAIMNARR